MLYIHSKDRDIICALTSRPMDLQTNVEKVQLLHHTDKIIKNCYCLPLKSSGVQGNKKLHSERLSGQFSYTLGGMVLAVMVFN